MRPVPAALVLGAAMSLIADELTTPMAGFSAPNRAYPLVTHLRGLLAHQVFGLAVAATCEGIWALRRRRP
ncbi:pyruvate/2-oxoglutarate dehydrogenase complex, dihydrolipoamide dehydrogenase component (plasmid) [Streptomyces sp. L7]